MISTVYNLMVLSFAMRCYSTAVPSLYTTCRFNVTEFGCPLYGFAVRECLKHEASCPEGTEYHCLRLHGDRSKYAAGCAQSKRCAKGEEPYWALVNDGIPTHVICDWCHDIEYFNPDIRLSSTYSHCPVRKVKCDYLNGIECWPENRNDVYKQDRLCRCDARNNYVFGDLEILQGHVCTSNPYLATACIHTEPCKDGQERMLNYTCVNKCKNGFRSDTSDECRPLIEPTEKTGEPTPTAQSRNTKETATTTTPRKLITDKVMPTLMFEVIQTTTEQIKGDTKSIFTIVIAVIYALLILFTGVIVWQWRIPELLIFSYRFWLRSKNQVKGRAAIFQSVATADVKHGVVSSNPGSANQELPENTYTI